MRILGFGHRKRVGKDSAAKFVLSHLKQNYPKLRTQRVSFGDQLKDISYKMFAWGGLQPATYYFNYPQEIEQIIPILGKTPRQIWDHMGMIGRDIHPRVWVEMAAHGLDCDLAISPDIRFPTEITLVEMFHGAKYKINRPSVPQVHTPVDEALSTYTGWTQTFENNGSLKEFYQNVILVCDAQIKGWFPNGR